MKQKIDQALSAEELRKLAEQVMRSHSDEVMEPLKTDEKRLFHELQVHQIELEMQNEALHEAQTKTQEACIAIEREHQRFLELFDSAPVAYFTLDENFVIKNANHHAANLLGLNRSQLINQDFSRYISVDYLSTFERFIGEIFSGEHRKSCEILLQIGVLHCWIVIEAIANKIQKSCLMAVLDINERVTTPPLKASKNT